MLRRAVGSLLLLLLSLDATVLRAGVLCERTASGARAPARESARKVGGDRKQVSHHDASGHEGMDHAAMMHSLTAAEDAPAALATTVPAPAPKSPAGHDHGTPTCAFMVSCAPLAAASPELPADREPLPAPSVHADDAALPPSAEPTLDTPPPKPIS
jgi:hypothetical protein